MSTKVETKKAPAAIGPYSQAMINRLRLCKFWENEKAILPQL